MEKRYYSLKDAVLLAATISLVTCILGAIYSAFGARTDNDEAEVTTNEVEVVQEIDTKVEEQSDKDIIKENVEDNEIVKVEVEEEPKEEPEHEEPLDTYINEYGIETHYGTMIYGSRYECFETEAGEDVIMNLWPEEVSKELGITFGDSENGPWLTLTEETDEYIMFEAIADGGHCTLKWYKYLSEIEFEAQKGELVKMNGKYIGLPD